MNPRQVTRAISKLTIELKDGTRSRFSKPHPEQRKLLSAILGRKKVLGITSRQIGKSTIATAWVYARMLLSKGPLQATLIAHEAEAADRLLKFMRGYQEGLPESLAPTLRASNRKELSFHGSGATARVLTAGGRSGGRSRTNQLLLLDELAFWPGKAQDLLGSVLSTCDHTITGNQIVCLSTPNGPGDVFHGLAQTAMDNPDEWDLLYFPWYEHLSYRATPPPDWRPCTEAVIEAVDLYGLDMAQAYWMHVKVAEYGEERFRKEFSATLEEGFMAGEGQFFTNDELHALSGSLLVATGKERTYEAPQPNTNYILGCDPAGGRGGDDSAIVVLNHRLDVVYVYASNRILPTQLGDKVAEIGNRYNRARVLVERNNHGETVIPRLQALGYGNLWKKDKKDWYTTEVTKLKAFEFACDRVPFVLKGLRDLQLVTQMLLIREKDGKVYHPLGSHDDVCVAWVLAMYAAKHVSAPVQRKTIPSMFLGNQHIL